MNNSKYRAQCFELPFGISTTSCFAVPVKTKLHPIAVNRALANSGASQQVTNQGVLI